MSQFLRLRSARPFADTREFVIDKLVSLVTSHVLPFISSAEDPTKIIDTALAPEALLDAFDLSFPLGKGRGESGLEDVLQKVLKYSVNTWSQGFMDKLYASTDPIGVASDLVLSVLNTNVGPVPSAPAELSGL